MKLPYKLMRGIFFLVAFSEISLAYASDLPKLKKNESYENVRGKMIKFGWIPFHSENADTCSEGDSRCAGRPEMESCAGSGMANCKFLWKKNNRIIGVCTVGEDAAYSNICTYP